jgi:mRNA interferase YafQ
MKYTIKPTSRFRKDVKIAAARGYDISLIEEVVDMLAGGKTLPEKYRDHKLSGKYAGYRDCHILPDWVLIYRIEEKALLLLLMRTGTHSDIDL